MAGHENRAENRRKAKEAAKEEMTSQDLLEEAFSGDDTEDEEENDRPAPVRQEENDTDPDIGGTEDETEIENALETKKASDVEKKAAEEAKPAEEAKQVEKKEETPPAEKKAEAEKKPEEKPKEAVPGEEAAPAPKVEEKKVEEKKEEEKPRELTPEEGAKLFSDWRDATEVALAEHHYKMTEKDVEEFNENPAQWVPKAMARVYLDCTSAAFQQFITYLPRMVDQVIEGRKTREGRENAFFAKWDKLIPHKETVYRLGTAYRKANPTASEEDFINEVGAQAMVALRITPDGVATAQEPEKKKSFTPASTASSTPTPLKPKSTNPFEQLAAQFSMEDLPEGN